MSEILFVVVATPANENFHPIYVKAENEDQARQWFASTLASPLDIERASAGQSLSIFRISRSVKKCLHKVCFLRSKKTSKITKVRNPALEFIENFHDDWLSRRSRKRSYRLLPGRPNEGVANYGWCK